MTRGGFRRRCFSALRVVLRTPALWSGTLGVALIVVLGTGWLLQSHSSVPADLFIQSVVQRDGTLGWHQLCPELQAQEPLTLLSDEVQQQRAVEAKQGLTLSTDYIGTRQRPAGGQIRLYVVTAHLPDGWIGQRTYIVYTRASGCVEDVKNF